MANLREAYEYAKNNPESDFAKKLEATLASGSLDEEAQKYGIDTSVFKPAVALTPKIQEQGFVQNVAQGITKPFLGVASQARDIAGTLSQIPAVLGGAEVQKPQGNYDYGYFGQVPSFGEATPDAAGAQALLKGAGAGASIASYLPMGGAVATTGKSVLARQLPKFFSLAKQGAASGALSGGGGALQDGGGVGDFASGTVGGAAIGAVATPVLGATAGVAAKPITRAIDMVTKPVETFKSDVVKNINKALSIQGKKSIGNAVNVAPEKRYQAFETLYDIAPEITVKDDIGQEVAFNPKEANFQQFGEALYKTKNNLWGKVESELKKATNKGLEVDITPALQDLNKIIETPGTPMDVIKTAMSLNDELMRFTTNKGTAPVEALARYNSFLNKKITGQLTGTTNNATREVEAILAKNLSESVDNSIEGLQGSGFAKLKDQYSSLKAIENDTVRRMQQELRMLDTGLADFMGQYGTADMIGGLVQAAQGNPTSLIRGVGTKVAANYMKSLREPSKYLRDAFIQIEKYKGGKGITPALEKPEVISPVQSFSKATVPKTVNKDTKGDIFWKEYLKNTEIDRKINKRAREYTDKRVGTLNEYGQRVIYPSSKDDFNPISEYEALSDTDKKALIRFLNSQPDSSQEAFVSNLTERLNAEMAILEQLQSSVDDKVKPLIKYESKRGEFKGNLNLNTGSGKFGKKYDDILPEYFDPSGKGKYAEDMVNEYYSLRDSWRQQKETVSQIKKELKDLKSKK